MKRIIILLAVFVHLNCNAAISMNPQDAISAGDIDDFDGLSKCTIAFWANIPTPVSPFLLVASDGNGSGDNGWYLELQSTTINFDVRSNGFSTAHLTNAASFGKMTHYAFVYDGAQGTDATKTKIYTNGVLGTCVFAGGAQPNSLPANVGSFVIGTNLQAAALIGFTGTIDDFSFWVGTALTASQVELLYKSRTRMMPVQLGASLYWTLDLKASGTSLTGNVVSDLRASRHGTVSGTGITSVSGSILSYP